MRKYNCYLLGNRYPEIKAKNISILEKKFQVEQINPIMVDSDSQIYINAIDSKEFYSFQGRHPLPGEIGCAASHLEIYKKMVKNNNPWALVLEDDAEIINSVELSNLIAEFIFDGNHNPAVYSLYTENFPIIIKKDEKLKKKFLKTKIAPPTTVAYLINVEAARLFIQLQNPIKFVADWPFSGRDCEFYLTSQNVVAHHNLNSSILGSKNKSREVQFFHKISIWSFYWFIKNRHSYERLSEYIEIMIKPRYLYHTKNLRDYSDS